MSFLTERIKHALNLKTISKEKTSINAFSSKKFETIMAAVMLQKSKFFLYVLYLCYIKFYFDYVFHIYVICFIISLLYIYMYIIYIFNFVIYF